MDITIIIPVRNRKEYIGRTLDSVLSSTVLPTEIIVVDNGSTDGTYEFCEQYAEGRNNIKLLRETQPGAAAARNCGLQACRTEWVYFFDSDDAFDARFLGAISVMETADYDMLAIPTVMRVGGVERVRSFIPSDDPGVQILGSILSTQNMVFRTSFIRAIGGWDAQCCIWDDWELGLRVMLCRPRILWLPSEAFHCIDVHDDSLTGESFTSTWRQIIGALHIALDDVKDDERLMLPLYYRTGVILGKVRNENRSHRKADYEAAVDGLRAFLHDSFKPTFFQRLACNLLIAYSHLGGRGAWRIAHRLCK